MKYEDKLGWITRLKLCWSVLVKGTFIPEDYKTRHYQRQWDICRQRDKEMQEACRKRTRYTSDSEYMEQ